MAPRFRRALFQSYPTAQPDGANPYPRVSDGAAAILRMVSPAAGRQGAGADGSVDLTENPAFNLVREMVADPPDRKTPEAPPGVSIAANMAEAAKHRGDPLPAKLLWFYNQVHNKGPWDFKQRPEKDPEKKQQLQDFGNYHYGVVGEAAGLPKWLLDRAAGAAQIVAGNSQHVWGTPVGRYPFGDDPVDQLYIDKGIADRPGARR